MSDGTKLPNSAVEPVDDGWDRGWEQHKRRQLIRMSRLTLDQKIQWLEDMQVLYEKLAKAQKLPSPKPESGPE